METNKLWRRFHIRVVIVSRPKWQTAVVRLSIKSSAAQDAKDDAL